MKPLSPELINAIATDTAVRTAIVYQSHEAFCSIYLRRHLKYDFAFFHKEMFRITEKYQHKLNVFMAFRGSGKSTILNLSNALWSITGKHKKKFVLIVSKTRVQSQSHFENIKQELEENELLKHDLGPFQATKEDWGAYTIEIPKYGAKIMCIGALQNIRGLKYRDHRPDLIICDDIEDITSFEYGEKVELLYEWFMGELLSIGDETTNIVVLGNLLNSISIMCKLAVAIRKGEMPGLFRAYPLLDDRNKILWSAKYPDAKAIKDIENGLPKPERGALYSIFAREYLLDMSYVRGDEAMDAKHATPIKAGGTTRKGFEISAPMWAIGNIMDMEDEIWINVSPEDGYPLESFKARKAKSERLRGTPPKANQPKPDSGFKTFADRPNRLW